MFVLRYLRRARPAASALAALLLISCLLVLSSCSGRGGGLLAGRAPSEAVGVVDPARLTDGIAGKDGDSWNSRLSVVFGGQGARVVYDLGETRPIRAAWLVADNDDDYELAASQDGTSFTPIWTAGRAPGNGVRPREGSFEASGRYVRLQARGGDGSYSVSELQIFSDKPSSLPQSVSRQRGRMPDEPLRSDMLVLGLALMATVVLARKGAGPLSWLLALGLPGYAAYRMVHTLGGQWPPSTRDVALARGIIAAVAAMIIIWETFAPRRVAPDRRASLAVLGVCGALGVLAFYNLGHPQFHNDRAHKWTPVHYLDLRQYQPTAKFFPELSYFGMYDADVAAYLEDEKIPIEKIARQPMRNLRTSMVESVGQRSAQIAAIRSRFSDARWEEYKRDARYFRGVMTTRHYLETMLDLGANATPVWMATGKLIFTALGTSDQAFLISGAIDPLLFLAMFIAIGRVFGLRAMFVTMVVFGCNDFIMFGTNWGGATLRHDWLAYLGLGCCALATRRNTLGGALFGAAAAVRVFPALAVIGAFIPPAWALLEEGLSARKLPPIRRVLLVARPSLDVLAGSLGAMGALMCFSMAVLPPSAWREWTMKLSVLSADSHANGVSLRAVIGGMDASRDAVMMARMPLYLAAAGGFIAMLVVASRGKLLHQAAMYGMILLPVLLFPANYYLHVVCLLPLAVVLPVAQRKATSRVDASPADEVDTKAWIYLLVMCALQYFIVLVDPPTLHFYLLGVSLLICLAAMLTVVLWRDAPSLARVLDGALDGTLAPPADGPIDVAPSSVPTKRARKPVKAPAVTEAVAPPAPEIDAEGPPAAAVSAKP
jgi:hypothetical protein